MAKIELELSEATIERLKRLAQERHSTVEGVVSDLVDDATPQVLVADGFWGLFADEADLMDDIVEDAMRARRERNARYVNG